MQSTDDLHFNMPGHVRKGGGASLLPALENSTSVLRVVSAK